ncbi:ComEC/Rec2 family competence protein [Candidatus Bealeia paramacronuclearis]|uniref:ComEC/Rec2 family competence protein n=1 Tax=Candidatus Bealeia paramacronuclearis TaxID=1921001 RepID=A0ABZ2C101_9PROT|nr:ComEC/Rec2 family competence protein [Candidatus Bealeia paramacronuclearis]
MIYSKNWAVRIIPIQVYKTKTGGMVSLFFKAWTLEDFYEDKNRWFLWVPVLMGSGIAIYFALPQEPPLWVGFLGIALFSFLTWLLRNSLLRLIPLAFLALSIGFSSASYRTYSCSTRMLNYPTPPLWMEGTVSTVELKASKKGKLFQRFILSDLVSEQIEDLPQNVRLTFRGQGESLRPGMRVKVFAKLLPVQSPLAPGTYDFRRQSYFQKLGGTGFILKSPEIVNLPEASSLKEKLETLRASMTGMFIRGMSSPNGAIGAALVTGDRAAIPEPVRIYFVDSGLAHVLAISGLHLTIVAGLMFFMIRRCLSLIPAIALRYPIKKWAALATIFMTFVYLGISGFGIPAQRSTIMTTAVMVAIMLDRTAISMRSIGLAAIFIFMTIPEAILSPSFQLSFAAVVGLIGAYESVKNPFGQWIHRGGRGRKALVYFGGITFSSLIATLATIPFTIYTFNRFTLHAIEANLVAIPLVGILIMPSAVVTCLLMPFGLEWITMPIYECGISLLVDIAKTVSSWPGANIFVATPSLVFVSLFTGGSLWLLIWRTPWRYLGIAPILLSLLDLYLTKPPDILIDEKGKTMAIRLPSGEFSVSANRLKTFTSEQWQRQTASSTLVKAKDSLEKTNGGYAYKSPHGYKVLILEKESSFSCQGYDLVLSSEPLRKNCAEAPLKIDRFDVWRKGAHAIWLDPKGIRIQSVRDSQGARPWTQMAIPRKDRVGIYQ